MLGLDKFRGFSVNSAKLLIPEAEDGSNLVGEATLPNHSVFTLELVRYCPSPIASLNRA